MGRLVVFALFATPLLAAPVPKGRPKIEEPSVNGTCQVVERINNGRPVRSRDCECWVIADDTYTIFDGMNDLTGVCDPANKVLTGARLSPDSQDPSVLDLMEGRNRDVSRMLHDGDTLHIAIAIDPRKTRPAEAKPGARGGVHQIPAGRSGEAESEREVTVSRTNFRLCSQSNSVATRWRPASPILRDSSRSVVS